MLEGIAMRQFRHTVGSTIVALLAAGLLFPASCNVVRLPADTEGPTGALALRIENATPTTMDVTVSVTLPADTASGTTADSAAAERRLAAKNLPAEATIRVGPASYSEGEVRCGDEVLISATVGDGADRIVQLAGAGTGTPGFDEGSLGLSGERTLLFDVHYTCGDTVVVRVTDDGTGVGDSSSSVGLGAVAIYNDGEVPPVGNLGSASGDTGGASDGPDASTEEPPDTVNLTIDNVTGSGIGLELTAGTGDPDKDSLTQVTVLPFGIAHGSLTCAQQLGIRALIVDSESGQDGGEPILYQIVLTGDGTGTVGFDQATIGPGNVRFLVQGEHYNCGDTVQITILDDAAGINEEEDQVPRIGLGAVDVLPAP